MGIVIAVVGDAITDTRLIQPLRKKGISRISGYLFSCHSSNGGGIMNETSEHNENVQLAENVDESRKFLGGIYHPWRRFFARTVDLLTGGAIATYGMGYVLGTIVIGMFGYLPDILINKIVGGIVLLISWMLVESVLLYTAGNTPGKWIFGISLRPVSGDKLPFDQALKRSFNVVFQGLGLGIPIVSLVTQIFAYKRLTKTGTTLWDTSAGCVVAHKDWGTARTFICFFTVFLVFFIWAMMTSSIR